MNIVTQSTIESVKFGMVIAGAAESELKIHVNSKKNTIKVSFVYEREGFVGETMELGVAESIGVAEEYDAAKMEFVLKNGILVITVPCSEDVIKICPKESPKTT